MNLGAALKMHPCSTNGFQNDIRCKTRQPEVVEALLTGLREVPIRNQTPTFHKWSPWFLKPCFFPQNLAIISSQMARLGFIFLSYNYFRTILCRDRESNPRQSCTSSRDLLRTLKPSKLFSPCCFSVLQSSFPFVDLRVMATIF